MKSQHTTERKDRGTIRHPSRVIGQTQLGAPIEIFLPVSVKPSLLVLAGQHGDEPETTALLSSALRTVASESLCAAVILAMNPDGLLRGTRGNGSGVDLNRNFPVPNWGEGDIAYRWTSKEPRDVSLSAGNAPASELETAALLSIIDELQPEYVVSIHAPLACVDCPLQSPLARWLAKEAGLDLVPDVGYPTPGSFGTWGRARDLKIVTLELPHLSMEELRLSLDPILVKLLSNDIESLLCADVTC